MEKGGGVPGGCDDAVEQNPTYNAITNEVTTQFVLNVASAEGVTRQSASTVQRNHNFRGMHDTHLIALSTGHSSWLAPYDGSSTTGFAVKKVYELGTLYGATAVDNTGDNNENGKMTANYPASIGLPAGAAVHHTQKQNEMSCYEHSIQDIRQTLKKNYGYMLSAPFRCILEDIKKRIIDHQHP